MIDLHCHVLSGIDDGPATVEESLALARAAARAGAGTLVATPHVSLRYPNTAERIAPLVDEMNVRLRAAQVDIEIRSGAEIGVARIADLPGEELDRLTLGGGRWLLIEPPFASTAYGLESIVSRLQRDGYGVVLAHPERCAAFHRDPAMLESIVCGGALTSITAGALVGRFGRSVRSFALQLAREGMVHNVASDAHHVLSRPPGVMAELEQAGLKPIAEWLTEAVPSAILGGSEIPRRPATQLAVSRSQGSRLDWLRRNLPLGGA